MADVIIRIAAKTDDYQKSLDKISSQTKNLENQLSRVAKISGVAFAGLVTTIGFAINEFAKFDNSLRAVRTLLDETSFGAKGLEAGFKEMRTEALRLGTEFPVEVDKINKALFDTVSAGVDAGKAIEVVGTSAKLATAGLTDITVATDGITSALNAYGLGADQAEAVAAKFFSAQVKGKTTVQELASGFGLVGASAEAAGVSLNELLGATAALTTAGIKTNAAYTGMKAAIANIAKPTQEATQEAAKLGIEFDATALRTKGLEKFLKDLTQAQGFTEESVTKLFGSVEAQNVIFALTGKQAKGFADNVRILGDEQANVSKLTEAYNIQGASLSNQLQRLSNSFKILLIQAGERLAPIFSKAVAIVQKFTDILNNNPGLIDFGAKAALLLTGLTGIVSVVSTGILVFLKLRTALLASSAAVKVMSIATKSLVGATGIGLLVIIVSELVANWETAWPKMQAVFVTFVNNVKGLLEGFGTLLLGVFTGNFSQIQEGVGKLKDTFAKGFSEAAEEFDKIDLTAKIQEQGVTQLEALAENNEAIIEQQVQHTEQINQMQLDLVAAENLVNKERLDAQKKANDAKLKDQVRFGKTFAEINAAIKSNEVQGFKQGAGELEQLTRSKNSTLKTIGKGAAIANIAIKSAEGAMNAYAGFSVIPIIGIPLGIAAAGAIIAFGVERTADVLAAQTGGLVTGGVPGRDSVSALLTPGELVTPTQNFEEVVSAVANARAARTAAETGSQDETEAQQSMVLIGFDGAEASQVLTARQTEDTALGISREA